MTVVDQTGQSAQAQFNAAKNVYVNGIPNHLMRLADRDARAKQVIEQYVLAHAAVDVTIGIFGTVVPGGTLPAIALSFLAQWPIYQRLSGELARIYSADPNDLGTGSIIGPTMAMELGAEIGAEFGIEWWQDLVWDGIHQLGIATVSATFIPVVSGALGAAIDLLLASAFTWRVGIMVIARCRNGGKWVGGDPRSAKRAASQMVGIYPNLGQSAKVTDILRGVATGEIGIDAIIRDRANLQNIPEVMPEVKETELQALLNAVGKFRRINPSITAQEIKQLFEDDANPVPSYIINEVLRRANL